jgi:hypothetical protein
MRTAHLARRDLDDRFTLIRATLRADVMRDMIFLAALALDQVIQGQCVMRPTPVAPAARMPSFWKRTHD